MNGFHNQSEQGDKQNCTCFVNELTPVHLAQRGSCFTELLGKQTTNCEKSADDNMWVCTAVSLLHGYSNIMPVCHIASPTPIEHKAK